MWLAEMAQRQEASTLTEAERAFFRVAVNLNKMRTSVLAHQAVNLGIEVLGGNGAIESFSILPRLLRDNVVYENWEGAHNVLRAQVLRDCMKLGVHRGFFDVLKAQLGEQDHAALEEERNTLEGILHEANEAIRDLGFRRMADRMATWVMLGGMAPVHTLGPAAAISRRHLHPLPLDSAYLGCLSALSRDTSLASPR